MLNTCRALAYLHGGAVLSKIDGGRWAQCRGGPAELIEVALEAQIDGRDLGPSGPAARDFVETSLAALRSGLRE